MQADGEPAAKRQRVDPVEIKEVKCVQRQPTQATRIAKFPGPHRDETQPGIEIT